MMFKLCLLFAFTFLAYESTLAQEPLPTLQPGFIVPAPISVYNAPPPIIYRPIVQYQPWQLQGATFQPRVYRTPLRNWLFGVGTVQYHYAPQGQQ